LCKSWYFPYTFIVLFLVFIQTVKKSTGQSKPSSIVYDLFQGRYRSTLTCPNCHQQSKTYDPFLSLSLPIQQKFRIPVFVTVVRLSLSQLWMYRIGLLFNSGDLIVDLRKAIAERDNIPIEQVCCFVDWMGLTYYWTDSCTRKTINRTVHYRISGKLY